MFLIDDLLLAPVNGFKFILGQIQKMADSELNDDTVIKEQLLDLQMRYELEEVSDDEFREREAERGGSCPHEAGWASDGRSLVGCWRTVRNRQRTASSPSVSSVPRRERTGRDEHRCRVHVADPLDQGLDPCARANLGYN